MAASDSELYKDKIEVSLDGRQVFYLFFGGAVIACLVFVLGVLVGKRVEARAHLDGAATTAVRDPLAALDQLDAPYRAAAGPRVAVGQVQGAVAELEDSAREAHRAAPAAAPVADKPAAKPADKPSADKPSADKPSADKKPAAKPAADKKPARDDDPAPAAMPEAAAAKPAADKKPADKKPADPKPTDAGDVAASAAPAAHPDEAKKKARYTLQLSSFQDKSEAESFLGTVKGAGYDAYLVEADVDGKGTFYRVRFGAYPSYDAAIDAKTEFEAKVKKVAYVTKL